MGVPPSEVGYTSAMPRREDHEVHKDMWGHWGEKILKINGKTAVCKINVTVKCFSYISTTLFFKAGISLGRYTLS